MAIQNLQSVDNARTLGDILQWRAAHQPHQPLYTFLTDAGETVWTFADLDRQARAIAALLQQDGTVGDRVLLLYPQSLDYVAAFFGCLYAGRIAVPAYLPGPSSLSRPLSRLQSILNDAQPTVALTTSAHLGLREAVIKQSPEFASMHYLATDTLSTSIADEWRDPGVTGDMVAFLQYTSGSTATPKGVIVSHANLIHNLAHIDNEWEHTEESAIVSWLPFFHDMGLIYGIMEPLYTGIPCYMMSPLSFVQRPFRWLDAISRYKATHTAAPNFAYDLCVRRVTPVQREQLDLSSWLVALNGAEPVRQHTLAQFAAVFEGCGFRPQAFCPGYGLAEATLKVTTVSKAEPPVYSTVQAADLEQHHIVLASDKEPGARVLVGCGRPSFGVGVHIVNPDTLTRVAADQVGEIWVSGPSVTHGYWQRPAETKKTFDAHLADTGEGPFLRTGDLGFLKHGHLFITGRLKDVIIIEGRNLYPQDIELTAEQSHPAVRQGCSAAFAVDIDNHERLVVTVEIDRRYQSEQRSVDDSSGSLPQSDSNLVAKAIRRAVSEEHDVQVYDVVLLKPGTISKTSSGKIQRHACRHSYLNSLQTVPHDA